jgi:Domain of unknown function (DUF3291)
VNDPRWHVAQLNVGRLLAPVESPAIEGFRARLEPINALADTHPGFVWRLQTEAGNATDIRPTEDELFLINMSVWESIEALRAFTYTTAHVQVLRDRRSWFEQLASGAPRAVVGPCGPHANGRRGAGATRTPAPGRALAGRIHVPHAVRARGGAPG